MSHETRHAQLVAWLENQGHSQEEIEKILVKVADYDAKTVHESIFDSIEGGAFDIQQIIDDALGE
ncbi:hypothetical protein NG895_17455 [Aeoliella sp. ICT_H6.2]|uniref:Uncharacterized protein n=1 Tax=Aeoliella straminimaris TaxID=2954799 RepID=A0A9X2JHP9_9BACT|nr:hypothetical protein [Aeoliella straminimaris]MCO6045687.1 hypothetical protein [Aeoliella straminimaris]